MTEQEQLLKSVEDQAEEMAEKTFYNKNQSIVAIETINGLNPEEINEKHGINQSTINSSKGYIDEKGKKAKRTLEAIKDGAKDKETAVDETFLEPRMVNVLKADPDRTFIFKGKTQDKLEDNPELLDILEMKDRHEIAEDLDIKPEQVTEISSKIRIYLKKAKETLKRYKSVEDRL